MEDTRWQCEKNDWKVQLGCLTVLFALAGLLTIIAKSRKRFGEIHQKRISDPLLDQINIHTGAFYRLDPLFEAFIPMRRTIKPITATDWDGNLFRKMLVIYLLLVAFIPIPTYFIHGRPAAERWYEVLYPLIGVAVTLNFYSLVAYLGKRRLEQMVAQ